MQESKYVNVCDCPPDGDLKDFRAGSFREVKTNGTGHCVHCGYIAMVTKRESLNKKVKIVQRKKSEDMDQFMMGVEDDNELSEEFMDSYIHDSDVLDLEDE